MKQTLFKDSASTMGQPVDGYHWWPVLKIVVVYAFFGMLWIYLSDTLLGMLTQNSKLLTQIAVLKGIVFITCTSLLLYALITRHIRHLQVVEEFLEKNEKVYSSLFENMQEGYAYCKMIYDTSSQPTDFTYIKVNKAFENLTGLKNVIGKNVSEVIPGIRESSPDLFMKYGNVALTGIPEKFETYVDLLKTWFSISVYSPEKKYFVAVFDVITERKRAEETLQENEELYRKLLTTVPDVIVRTDLEGTILFINDTAFSSFGYSDRELLIGKNVLAFVDEKDRTRVAVNTIKMFRHALGPEEYTLIGNEGVRIDCEVNGNILRHNDGIPFGIVFFIRDLTEKKKMQIQLVQSQKMEAVGRLAGGIAHDYNNMLGVILGYASMIERELPPVHPAQSKIKAIISAADRTVNLTKQLLAFARQQVIAPIVLNLNDELTSLQKMLGRLIGEDIKLVFNQEQKLWSTKIDPTQFTQIVTNLATNARDAIENVGRINIATANVLIDEAAAAEQGDISPGEFVMLSFSDSGGGIDKKIMTHIFEPFFTTKPKDKGTGLGLATVFGIVKQNNGFINVSSERGHGTTFKIYFPRFMGASSSLDEAPEELSLNGTETILVVEDEEQLLQLVKVSLEGQGYNVLSAISPIEASALCEKFSGQIHLLVTDVVMPGMNGKELKEWMEQKYQTIKTLFISGYTSDIVAKRGVLDEGMHFLQKPFAIVALLKKVKEILRDREENS